MSNMGVKGNHRMCAIYARVSTGDQHPGNQVGELSDYAERHGWMVFGVYIDECSGVKSSRPRLMDLLADAHDKRFSVILVWSFDRLGRSL